MKWVARSIMTYVSMSSDIVRARAIDLLGILLGFVATAVFAEEPNTWLTSGGDEHQSYFSTLTLINESNVVTLGQAWTYDLNTTAGLEATQVVVDGVMYASGPGGSV